MPTLLEYLTTPNLEVDRSPLPKGPNTNPGINTYEPEGIQAWTEFTLETMLTCFGDVLHANFPSAHFSQPPPIAPYHLQLTGEPALDAILKKHNHTIVDHALQLAQLSLQDRGLCLPISWSWGQLSSMPGDSRFCPDWAGTIHSGRPPFTNRVPGETKQSQKWHTDMKFGSPAYQREFSKPVRQLHGYCVVTNTRYGYIVTDAQAVFFRRIKSEEPAVSLAQNRPPRQLPPRPHRREASIASVISQTSAMSLETSGTQYTDAENPDINERPLEMAVVPWSNSGVDQITINLAIWFIHLLATSDISVEESYSTLGVWQKQTNDDGQVIYRQVGSGRTVDDILPPGATLDESAASS